MSSNRKKLRCPNCEKGELIEVNDIVNDLDGYFFVVRGKKCDYCEEEFIGEEEGQGMIRRAKKLRVWGASLKLPKTI